MMDALTLPEATLWLWPQGEAGEADLLSPIWSGLRANTLSMERVPITAETRPTGVATPRRHVLVVTHMITVGHVLVSEDDEWVPPLPGAPMVLQITWVPETWAGQTRDAWLRRLYKGVSLDADSESEMEGVSFNRSTKFAAQTLTESAGSGIVPLGTS